jgi:hypothetical protein
MNRSGHDARGEKKLWTLVGIALALVVGACNAVLGTEGGSGRSLQTVECTGGTVDCGGNCVSTATHPENCGACGTACGAGEFCESGTCIGYCVPGEEDCGGLCQVTASDRRNCGGCGRVCESQLYCDQGACSDTCTGTICVDAQGGETCAHLASDNDNCGSCGKACPDGKACQGGACIEACPYGRLSCSGLCVDVRTDANNCGGCGVTCEPGVSCLEGSCGGGEPICTGGTCACGATQKDCNGVCVNTQSNALHCGDCGMQCAPGQLCNSGVCECPSGGELCAGACTDVLASNAHCGACDAACTGGTSCQAGVCECEETHSLCDEICVDQKSDPTHCGGCGIQCAGYESCVEGICKYDGDQCGGAARNINVSRVSLYQAVETHLFQEGALVPVQNRAVDVIRGRDAMVRVFVAPQEGFSSRELSARVFVENDGEIEAFFSKMTVSGASVQNSLASTFQVDLPAAVIGASTQYWVELVECGVLPEGNVGVTRVPTEATELAELAARQTGLIKMVFVPVTHDGRTPDVTEPMIDQYVRAVERLYPTVGVEWSVRAAIPSNQSGTNIDLGTTLDQVTNRRQQDNVASDIYYYGLIDPAASFNTYCQGGCTTGVAWVTGASGNNAAAYRAGVGVGFGNRGVGTYAHELGHNHGRNHAPCNVSGDQNYPYAGGGIGVWGYDREARQLKDPSTHTDFMGYCNTNWVSDYSYRAYASRIATVNGVQSLQALEIASREPPATWRRMIVTGQGARWSSPIDISGPPGENSEPGYVYDSVGNVIAVVDVYRVEMSHTGGFMLHVPVPQPGWYAIGAANGPILAY